MRWPWLYLPCFGLCFNEYNNSFKISALISLLLAQPEESKTIGHQNGFWCLCDVAACHALGLPCWAALSFPSALCGLVSL
jgi:hypothetical protein